MLNNCFGRWVSENFFLFLIEGQKCSHSDPIESSDSYGDLSDTSDLKTPEKQSTNGSFSCDMAVSKNKMETEAEKKYPCPECGSFFRSKSYLNKHIQKVHVRALGGPLGDLGPALGSPFSPQQNMSLLESFGFQIVQSAFASSLVDPEVDQQPMGPEGKWDQFDLKAKQQSGYNDKMLWMKEEIMKFGSIAAIFFLIHFSFPLCLMPYPTFKPSLGRGKKCFLADELQKMVTLVRKRDLKHQMEL